MIMIFSVGFAFAEDANQTDSTFGVTNDTVISDGGSSNYGDLQNEFPSGVSGTVNLAANYTFDETKDKYKQVEITGSPGKEIVINGNNHVIDGNGKAGALKISNAAVTINNLVFKNSAISSIIVSNSTLVLNNVYFMDNNDSESGAAIFCDYAAVTANNCLFSDNYAPKGGAIYVSRGDLETIKSTFTNKNPVDWSLVYAVRSKVNAQQCLFENATSKYATALYADTSNVNIFNSRFNNLSASVTAGAIASKRMTNLTVKNCEFENIRSVKNGGAIFADINADSENLKGTTLVNATKFINCKSGYGGAILQLGGSLIVIFSDFIGNDVDYNGGAIYASNATFYAGRDNFTNNQGYSYTEGGAIYLDYTNDVEIEWCEFTNNKAAVGGAICLMDSTFKVTNTTSHNNGEFIHAYFAGKGSHFADCENDDKYNLDDVYYQFYVNHEGKQIVLNPIKINGSASDESFDLRDFNAVTPVKNQGSMGACWAFGTAGAIESAFKMATGIELDISEDNIQNSGLRYSYYGKPSITEGGYLTSGLGYVLSWLGIVNAEYDSYDELGKISPVIFADNSYHITDAIRVNNKDKNAVKEALIKYGGLTIHVNGADPNTPFYNPKTAALYCNDSSLGNHFVTLVGWNDTYSASNFKINPGVDGAWICKNSWGSDWGDGGYFYLSYADAPFNGARAIGYIINNTDVYNKVYQYDIPSYDGFLRYSSVDHLSYINSYKSSGNDLIAAVGTYFDNDRTEYKINIYVNGNIVYSQNGKSLYTGFHTIKLDKTIAVNKGDKISAEFEVNTNIVPYVGDSRLYFEKGNSIVNTESGYADLAEKSRTAVVKIYTLNNVNNVTGTKSFFSKSTTVVKYAVDGAVLVISELGKTLGWATVNNGEAVFNTTFKPGNYTISTTINNTEIISTFEVLHTIIVSDEFNVTYNSKYPIEITLMDDNGTYLNNTKVTGFVDGKQVTLGTTDGNGSLIISPADLKLKTGIHKIVVVNNVTDEEAFVNVKVASRFSGAKNISLYYYDGTAFKVRVYDDAVLPVKKGTKVIFNIKGKNYARYTDSKGYASFKIPNVVTPGTYKIKVKYAGETVTKTVKVKQVIKAKKTVTVKKSAKKLVYKITLKGKKVLKYKKVTLKVKGKTLKAKTNKKGVAQFTINKNIIKTLKVGKKYTMKVTYLKDTVKSTLKVKR